MFLGRYEIDGDVQFAIYYKNRYGYEQWCKETFSPTCENIEVLDFTIKGNTYQERKACLEDIAIDYSNHFASLSLSYGELAEICDWFYKNGKRYGLLKEFRENAIC